MPCTGFRQDLPNVGSLLALGALRGEWRLDDPVSKYIIELHGGYISRVTIGQLATRTSGLLLPTDRPPWPNAPYSLAEFIDMLNAWLPHAVDEPGKQRIHSHASYVPLRLALALWSCFSSQTAPNFLMKPAATTSFRRWRGSS